MAVGRNYVSRVTQGMVLSRIGPVADTRARRGFSQTNAPADGRGCNNPRQARFFANQQSR
jgi:hypothetical protein